MSSVSSRRCSNARGGGVAVGNRRDVITTLSPVLTDGGRSGAPLNLCAFLAEIDRGVTQFFLGAYFGAVLH